MAADTSSYNNRKQVKQNKANSQPKSKKARAIAQSVQLGGQLQEEEEEGRSRRRQINGTDKAINKLLLLLPSEPAWWSLAAQKLKTTTTVHWVQGEDIVNKSDINREERKEKTTAVFG